uniref:ZP domain-containing protein n=1 Tax=Bursaphelenchus xylophilus TaxID=6326 RepID=A0A1I7SF35_BURXY
MRFRLLLILASLVVVEASLKPTVFGAVNRKRSPSAPVSPLKLISIETVCKASGISIHIRTERKFTGHITTLLDPVVFRHAYHNADEINFHLCHFQPFDNGEQFGLRGQDDPNGVQSDGSFSRLMHDVDVLPDVRTQDIDGQLNVPVCDLYLEKGSAFGNIVVPGSYRAQVVLQAHGLNAPEIVTHQDQIIQVSCDYTEFLRKHYFNTTDRFIPEAFIGGFSQVFPNVEGGEKIELGEKKVTALVDDLAEARFELLPPLEEYDFVITRLTTSAFCDNLEVIKEGCPIANLSNIAYVGEMNTVTRTVKTFNLLPMDFLCDTKNGIAVHYEYVVCKGNCHRPVCPGQNEEELEQKPEIKLSIRKTSQVRPTQPDIKITQDEIEVVCRNDGIHLNFKMDKPFYGEIHLVDYYDTCNLGVVNETQFEFNLGKFGRRRPFGGQMTDEDFDHTGNCSLRWSLGDVPFFTGQILISQNKLRMPELITSMDQVFKFTCDYSEAARRKSTTRRGLGRVSQVFPSPDRAHSPFSQQMVDSNGELNVDLDEIIELNFEMVETTPEYQDFYIKECTIGRKSRLRYVEHGCISPTFENKLVHGEIDSQYKRQRSFKIQPFLFMDDSDHSALDVECTFEYCVGACEQPDCAAMAEEEKEAERPTVTINVNKLSMAKEETTAPVIPTHFIQTLCTGNGIHVEVRDREPFSGRFYAMRRAHDCYQHSEHSGVINMFLGLPQNFTHRVEQPNCDIREFENNTLGQFLIYEPDNSKLDGLLTPLDRIYWIKCNYSGYVHQDSNGVKSVEESMEPFFGKYCSTKKTFVGFFYNSFIWRRGRFWIV